MYLNILFFILGSPKAFCAHTCVQIFEENPWYVRSW